MLGKGSCECRERPSAARPPPSRLQPQPTAVLPLLVLLVLLVPLLLLLLALPARMVRKHSASVQLGGRHAGREVCGCWGPSGQSQEGGSPAGPAAAAAGARGRAQATCSLRTMQPAHASAPVPSTTSPRTPLTSPCASSCRAAPSCPCASCHPPAHTPCRGQCSRRPERGEGPEPGQHAARRMASTGKGAASNRASWWLRLHCRQQACGLALQLTLSAASPIAAASSRCSHSLRLSVLAILRAIACRGGSAAGAVQN